MSNRPNRAFLALALLSVLGIGCANLYQLSYVSSLDRRNRDELSRIVPPMFLPRLVTSNDLKADYLRMRENGYLLVGKSKFRSSPIDQNQALDQAKKVGAEIVLVNKKYVNSSTQSVPMSEWLPGQRIDHSETTVIQKGDATPTIIQRQNTTQVQGEFHTTFVEQNVDYYDYTALYWAKAKPSILGVLVKALDSEAKSAIESNKGVLVRAVVRDSPAYDADVLRDDILVKIGEEDIRDPDQFFDLVERYKGKSIDLMLYRRGNYMTLTVKLGQE